MELFFEPVPVSTAGFILLGKRECVSRVGERERLVRSRDNADEDGDDTRL